MSTNNQSMGIKDGNASEHTGALSPKAGPTAGGVAAPGVSSGEKAHTPMYWASQNDAGDIFIHAAAASPIFGMNVIGGTLQDAENICRACNSHEQLVEALKECADRFERCCIHSGSDKEFAASAVEKYRALLSAGGKS